MQALRNLLPGASSRDQTTGRTRPEHLDDAGQVVDPEAYYAAVRRRHDEPEPSCPVCGDHRFIVRRRGGDIATDRTEPCGRCAAAEKFRRWQAIGVSAVVRYVDLLDDAAMRPARQACEELLDGKRWCVLISAKTGRGKTYLARATLVEWVERGRGTALFRQAANLLDELRDTYDAASPTSVATLLERYRKVGLLVIDDLGAERGTEWAQEKLLQIIDGRYERKRATLVTTNANPMALDSAIPYRVRSRLASGTVVVTGGRDWRAA